MKAARIKVLTGDFLTVFGFLLTALGTYLTYRASAAGNIINNELFIGGCILVLITTFGWFRYFHRAKLFESIIECRGHLDDAKNMIMELGRDNKKCGHIQQCPAVLSEICQKIAVSFRKFHEPEIAVCIHYVNRNETGKAYVNILCRNTDSKRRPESTDPPATEIDYIDDNTDFKSIFPKLRSSSIHNIYYFNNFLPWSCGYKNSHFSSETQKKYYGRMGFFHRVYDWKLPYKSTIVVPLIVEEYPRKREIQGFLSIDSTRQWAFSRDHDLPLLIGLAKDITPIIKIYANKNL
ncbi:MAG: hypothetical protein HDS38_04520 [Bacteroides sp.]|nr:hypothetical protein [Bacteroides sp.]